MGREVLQLEPMSSNKPQKPLISLQIELWRYILGEGQRECPQWSLHLFVISAQGGKGIKQAKMHSMARTQGTKVKQSFNSPATCFSWLPAHLKTSSKLRVRLMYLLSFLGKRRLWASQVSLCAAADKQDVPLEGKKRSQQKSVGTEF